MSTPEHAAVVLAVRLSPGQRLSAECGRPPTPCVVEVDLELVPETTFEVDRHQRRAAMEVEHRPGMALQPGQALIELPARSGQVVLVEAHDATDRRA